MSSNGLGGVEMGTRPPPSSHPPEASGPLEGNKAMRAVHDSMAAEDVLLMADALQCPPSYTSCLPSHKVAY